jgi:alanyl-tRNA synthetase
LSAIARSFSAAFDDTPSLVQATLARLEESDKAKRRMSLELAAGRGRALYDQTAPRLSGVRLHRKAAALNDDTRAEAQAFTAGTKAVYIGWQDSPPSLLLACSTDTGVHAGNLLKELITGRGGRGGGSATLAQASIPADVDLGEVLDDLESRLALE